MNTAEKRRAAVGAFLPWGTGVTPNVNKDAEWRRQVAWNYSFLTTGAGVAWFVAQTNRPEFAAPTTRPQFTARDNKPEFRPI